MAQENSELVDLANELEITVQKLLGEVAMSIGQKAMSSQFKTAFTYAFPFLEVMGDVIMAWMLLWRAALARQRLTAGTKKRDIDFYEGQIKSSEFFIYSILPTTRGKMNGIVKYNGSAVEISDAAFGG
jgi:hypothetical protein